VAEGQTERLDRFIVNQQPQLSRSFVQSLLESGLITVNGRPAKASQKLKPGDGVSITLPPPEPSPLAAEDVPLVILYEDEDLLVVDKPAGMTTHPSPGHRQHTLVNALLSHLPNLPEADNPERPGIVHRLDKDTSGLIIVAKNRHALASLAAQFGARTVKKTYLTLVTGKVTPPEAVIDAPIGRDPKHRQRMSVLPAGRAARTGYRVVKYFAGYTLLEASPETGRTHQIRVHMAAVGHPVLGDSTYGKQSSLVARQFLHAHRIAFKLPGSGRAVEFTSELPADLRSALEALG
jgi:23S rRNA pseudouridine1911/1915/1917 synthase